MVGGRPLLTVLVFITVCVRIHVFVQSSSLVSFPSLSPLGTPRSCPITTDHCWSRYPSATPALLHIMLIASNLPLVVKWGFLALAIRGSQHSLNTQILVPWQHSHSLLPTEGTTITHLSDSWVPSTYLLPHGRKCPLSSPRDFNHMEESQALWSKSILTVPPLSVFLLCLQNCEKSSSVFSSTVSHPYAHVSRSHPSIKLGSAPGVLISSLNPESEMSALMSITIPSLSNPALWSVTTKFTSIHMQSPTVPLQSSLLLPRIWPVYASHALVCPGSRDHEGQRGEDLGENKQHFATYLFQVRSGHGLYAS